MAKWLSVHSITKWLWVRVPFQSTKLNKLNPKVNKSNKKNPDATTLIHINQYNIDKQNLQKNIRDFDKKYQTLAVWSLQLFLIQTLNILITKHLTLVV